MALLNARITQLEHQVQNLRPIATPGAGTGARVAFADRLSSPPAPVGSRASAKVSKKRTCTNEVEAEGGRKKLNLAILPDNAATKPPVAGLPTPMLSVSKSFGQRATRLT